MLLGLTSEAAHSLEELNSFHSLLHFTQCRVGGKQVHQVKMLKDDAVSHWAILDHRRLRVVLELNNGFSVTLGGDLILNEGNDLPSTVNNVLSTVQKTKNKIYPHSSYLVRIRRP